MPSPCGKKLTTKYEGWKEPKIAISFLNHSHIYYGMVWKSIVTLLVLSNNQGSRAKILIKSEGSARTIVAELGS